MSYRRAVILLVTGLAVLACKPGRSLTRKEVARRNAPKIAELRAKLEKVAALIDAQGSAFEPVTPDPPMVYDAATTGAWRGNADFLPYDMLRLTDHSGESGVMGDGRFRPLDPTAAPLRHLFAALDAAQYPPLSEDSNEAQLAAYDAELFKRALATRYVIVVRMSIEVQSDNTGRVTADALAVDIEKLRVVASASALAIGPMGSPPINQPHMPIFLPYELEEDARKQLFDKLATAGMKIIAKPGN